MITVQTLVMRQRLGDQSGQLFAGTHHGWIQYTKSALTLDPNGRIRTLSP